MMHFPGESKEYRAARESLLQKEIELRRSIEEVARLRRALPPGGALKEDYVFKEWLPSGEARDVKLSSLFGPKHPALAVYSFMFGPEKQQPCAGCTPLLDGLNGVEDHIRQRVNLAVVAASPPERLFHWARERGWNRLRLLSTEGTTYSVDYHGKNEKGHDETMMNVFRRDDGVIRHFWATEMVHAPMDPGQHHRALDLFNPIFHLFDIIPNGRGENMTKVRYT